MRLPAPETFQHLQDAVPHYATHSWKATFEIALFREIAEKLVAGATLLTDLDHTAYAADAGLELVYAAIHTGLISNEKAYAFTEHARRYTEHFRMRENRDDKKAEFDFYSHGLKIFTGIPMQDLEQLSHLLWWKGIPGFHEGKALCHSFHPEMLYLYALAAERKNVYAVSASPNFVLLPALSTLGLEPARLRAMELRINQTTGVLTEEITRIVYGESKIDAARKMVSRWEIAVGDNPRNDLPFLKEAKTMAFGVGNGMTDILQILPLAPTPLSL